MDKEVLKRQLTERFQETLDAAVKAVDGAPDGQWIAASEWEVRDIFQKLTADCFGQMIQTRIDRPRVMIECLRMIATLKLNPARQQLIHSFMNRYLRLSQAEERMYNEEVESMSAPEREAVMQIMSQWEERAAKRSVLSLVTRLLQRKFGELPVRLRGQIEKLPQEKLEELGEAMLDLTSVQQIQSWLRRGR